MTRGSRRGAAGPVITRTPGRPTAWRLGEALGCALGVLVAGTLSCILLDPVTAILATGWAVGVAVVVRSDLDRYIIPDAASAGIALLGLANAVVAAGVDGWPAAVVGAAVALLGGAAAFGCFLAVALLYRWRSGREGLGFGDVKLAGACGFWLSAGQQTAALEIACVAALGSVLLMRRAEGRRAAVPFGAFLAPAAWLVFVLGPTLGRWLDLAS